MNNFDRIILLHALKNHKISDQQILSFWDNLDELADKLKINLASSQAAIEFYIQNDITCIYYGHPLYPKNFYFLSQPPLLIYCFGKPQILQKDMLAIVGTREASNYGILSTDKIIAILANFDLNIVSGLARGIDSAVHEAALNHELATTAVLGSGLLNFGYGANQKILFNKIKNSAQGLIISEFEPKFSAETWTFSYRNRLIAALAKYLIIIEASENSGSLVTAQYAKDLSKPIFALTADISKSNFAGNQALLSKKIARPIFDPRQFANLDLKARKISKNPINSEKRIELSPKQLTILKEIKSESISFDELSMRSGLQAQELLQEISILEINGLIKKLNGNRLIKN